MPINDPNLINMRHQYKNYLKTLVYSELYDIHVHSIQTALTILGFANRKNIDKNSMKYGYFDVNTENMLISFQEDSGLYVDGKISEDLWGRIFDELARVNQCIIVKTGERQISIYDIDKLLHDRNLVNKVGEGLGDKLDLNKDYSDSLLDDSMWPSFGNGELAGMDGSETVYWDGDYVTGGGRTTDRDMIYNLDGGKSFPLMDFILSTGGKVFDLAKEFISIGAKNFDDIFYEYLVKGGKVYTDTEYSYNIDGGKSWNNDSYDFNVNGSSNKDYDYISNLLSNSIFEGALEPSKEWKSKTDTSNIGAYGGTFYESNNYPFFYPTNIDQLKRSKFDIDIVYGPKGESAKRIVEVTPISVTQEVDASGEPIFDLYEFVAKDIVISKHKK